MSTSITAGLAVAVVLCLLSAGRDAQADCIGSARIGEERALFEDGVRWPRRDGGTLARHDQALEIHFRDGHCHPAKSVLSWNPNVSELSHGVQNASKSRGTTPIAG